MMPLAKITLIVFIVLIVAFFIIKILFPSHPESWLKLSYGMDRSNIMNIIDNDEIQLVKKFNKKDRIDLWQKNYLTGKWFLKCYYNLDLKFMYADVYYKSTIFPFVKRQRSYPK